MMFRKMNMLSTNENAAKSSRSAKARVSRSCRALGAKVFSVMMSALLVVSLSPASKVSLASADSAEQASLSSAASQLPSGTYWYNGDVDFTTIDSSNTFASSVWDDYRDNGYDGTGNALGIAGSFHLVAFDTLNTAGSHVYGNMLAKNMTGNQDFGTDSRFDDLYGHSTLTYIQNYQGTHSRFGATSFAKQAVVFGSNTDTFSLFSVNENGHDIINYGNTKTTATKVEFPAIIGQDLDSSTTPFININDVKAQAVALSNTLASRSSLGGATFDFSDMNNKQITYTKGSGCAYVELSLSDITSNGNPIRINNVPTDGTGALVINVDCQGSSAAMPDQIILNAQGGRQAGVGEVDSDTGYVLWNFYNASGATITGAAMVSSILAPGATLNLQGNACGTFIADNITVTGETHTRPFHGKFDKGDTTSVSVEKKWLDSKGEAEVDVAHGSITAELWYADASGNATTAVTDASGNPVTMQLSAENGWKYTWSDLPTKKDGQALQYTVKESGLSDVDKALYDSSVSASGNSFTITNQHKAEVSVSATKVWKDNDNIDKLRPTSVTLSIVRQIDGGAWTPTGETLVLNADNGWAATKAGLPATDADGKVYTYSLQEAEVTGYTGSIASQSTPDKFGNVSYTFEVTNTHQASKVNATVTKAWADDNNRDGIRAGSVEVNLMRSVNGGDTKQIVGTKTLSAGNNWTATFEDLPVRGADGTYTYSIDEVSVAGYTGTVATSTDEYGNYTFALTNTHEVAKTSVGVHKVWNDSNDADGIRPASVTAQLCTVDAQGAVAPVAGKTVVLSADNNWTAGWTDLPAKEAGAAIKYAVREVEVPDGYKVSIDGGTNEDGTFTYTMTNTHEAEDVEFSLSGYSVRSISEPVPDAEKVCYVDPKVNKALVGRALADGEFTFQLIDDASPTGQVVSTASNDKYGMVDFDKANNVTGDDMNPCCLKFTAKGTYTYTVREDPNAAIDPTIEYSKQVVTFVTTIDEVKGEDGSTSLKETESKYVCYDSEADRAAGVKSKEIVVTGSDNDSDTEHPTITNSVKAIQLGLTKFNADSSATLPGAVYGLYRSGSVSGGDATDAVLVAKATSDANGHMTFATTGSSEVISTDTDYWFQEISAPEGYKLSSAQTQKFQIKRVGEGAATKYQLVYADGSTSKEYSVGTVIEFGDGSGVTDEALTIKVNKVDSARAGLAGAKLGVRLADGTEAIEEWTSNGAGHVLNGLVAGKQYVLYESEAPNGFAKASDVTFTVDETGAIKLVDGAFAKVNDSDVLNAYATADEASLVNYKQSETVEKKVVQKEVPKTSTSSSTKASAVKTGDSIPVLPIAIVVVVCLAVAVTAGVMSRRKGK